MSILLFGIYSWVTNLFWLFSEFMPFPIRNLAFKLILRDYGKGSFIDYGCYIRYPSRVSIGKRVSINRNCRFFASHYVKDVRICIEDDVAIAPSVTLFAAGHDYHLYSLPDIAKSITIKKFSWIGGQSIILPGVTIGEGAVVAAGSVVTSNVEPYNVVGGNPARLIKKREMKEFDGSQEEENKGRD